MTLQEQAKHFQDWRRRHMALKRRAAFRIMDGRWL